MFIEDPFGYIDGQEVTRIILSNENGYSVSLLSYGATIQSLLVPSTKGIVDVCLGYDYLEQYVSEVGYFGACIGRYANRIENASFIIADRRYKLTANEGVNHLHGGNKGFDKRIWSFKCDDQKVDFMLHSDDMEEGYPGNLEAKVSYSLLGNGLCIEYYAESDAATYVNLTNHSYFNLSGAGNILDHVLIINADYYTPCKEGNIPTGYIMPVSGMALDFSQKKAIGDRIQSDQLSKANGYDHNFVLRGEGERHAATVFCPRSGMTMDVITDNPGLQFYTGNFITPRKGKRNLQYDKYSGMCLETQYFPNSMNVPGFHAPLLNRGDYYYQKTFYLLYENK